MSENTLYISEILELVNREKTEEAAIKKLKELKTPSLINLFEAAYHEAVKWELPPGRPPFIPDKNPLGNNAASLTAVVLGLFRFLNSPNKIKNPMQRELLFIQALESLNVKEAEILLAAKNRNLATVFPRITHSFVLKAFPNLYQDIPLVPEHPVRESEKRPLAVGAPSVPSSQDAPVKKKPGPKKGWKKAKVQSGQ